eukprot:scaffold3152_cov67-Phaeocystis_antarctica.AAC.5
MDAREPPLGGWRGAVETERDAGRLRVDVGAVVKVRRLEFERGDRDAQLSQHPHVLGEGPGG